MHVEQVLYGFGEVWKGLRIDNIIFQDLESFGKERFSNMVMEMFWIFAWKDAKIP